MTSDTSAIHEGLGGTEGECSVCEMVEGTGDALVVLEDGIFSVCQSNRFPWGLVICTTEHNEGYWTLPEDQAAELGKLIVRIASAMMATWTDKVYVAAFGEEALHVHFLLVARHKPISDALHEALYVRTEEMAAQSSEAHRLAEGVRDYLANAGTTSSSS